MLSPGVPWKVLLPALLRGSGESRSTTALERGAGLDLATGIREMFDLLTLLLYEC